MLLGLFLAFLLLSIFAMVIAWAKGRQWGDLSSRRRYGEALTEEERSALRKSFRAFLIWAGISLLLAVLSFYALS